MKVPRKIKISKIERKKEKKPQKEGYAVGNLSFPPLEEKGTTDHEKINYYQVRAKLIQVKGIYGYLIEDRSPLS